MTDIIKTILRGKKSKNPFIRKKIVSSATAFAGIVMNGSNPQNPDSEIKIDRPFNRYKMLEINALSEDYTSFRVARDLLKDKAEYCVELMSIFHEVSHIMNDNRTEGMVVEIPRLEVLVTGDIINYSDEEFNICLQHELQNSPWKRFLDKDTKVLDEDKYLEISANSKFIANFIYRCYYNQAHEVRARAWSVETMRELLRMSKNERELGNLTEQECIQLDHLTIQFDNYLDIINERDCVGGSEYEKHSVPSKEERERFKIIITSTMEKYKEYLPRFIERSPRIQEKLAIDLHIENPIEYLTTALQLYYDDNTAHDLFNLLIKNMNTGYDYINTIKDLCCRTPISLSFEEQQEFINRFGLREYKDIKIVQEENLKTQNFDLFDPEVDIYNKPITFMPNRTVGERINVK